ncbi:glycosyltransferase family 39 protein [Candidatus Woesebacteria bacterium]|nr:glycosyltransferase family 39 protein [Candidatus Woesebacteria bacterium]
MKFFQKILSRANFWPLVIVVFFGLLAGRTLLPSGYFNMHDDLQMMRQLELEKCFLDLQIPCRWVPDMGYGFGFPLFNFYPPLPYLFGEVFRLVGFTFVVTVKLTFILSFVASGITMYFLAKEFFGKTGGVLSSVFYIWAPYHSVDVFVRGAMNEAWALAWFPLILWAGYSLVTGHKKQLTRWTITLALSWAALFLSHNLMVLIFTPIFGAWCLIFLYREKKWERIKNLILAGLLTLGLSAFFTFPAVLEQKYVQVNTLIVGYYEYIAHFASLSQLLISRFWGYGASVWAEDDGMPFPVGHMHWILSLVIAAMALYGLWKTRRKKSIIRNSSLIVLFFIAVGWLSTFMAHSRSTPIWQLLPPMKFVQFPWRFLTLSTLSFSFIVGALTLFIKNKKLSYLITGLLMLGLLLFNWDYFKPEKGKLGPLTDEQKFTAAAWELQQTAGIYDYLPKDAIQAPQEPRKFLAEILEGEGIITDESEGTTWAKFKATIMSEGAKTRIGIFKFPNWRAFVDGKEVTNYIDKSEVWGRMYIDLPKGEHQISLKLFNTPVRTVSNIISLVTWSLLLSFPYWKKRWLS